MENSVISLLVLGAVAVFLILKLRSVLGTRDGFEGKPKASFNEPRQASGDLRVVRGGKSDEDFIEYFAADSDDTAALRKMQAIEKSFNLNEFLKGARGAYEMILMAFENGNIERVKPFLAPEVYDGFVEVIKDRELRGMNVQATFVGLKELTPQGADFDDTTKEGELTVRFVGELTRIVKDRSGSVVDGHATDIVRQRDVWTFARVFGSNDPNWQLVATSD
ncbi:MAG: Tim44/TimA family putative adaptor protein [Deltaproteobacteria bacterium]